MITKNSGYVGQEMESKQIGGKDRGYIFILQFRFLITWLHYLFIYAL